MRICCCAANGKGPAIEEQSHENPCDADASAQERPARAPCARVTAAVVLAALAAYLLLLSRGPITMARGSVFDDAYVLMASEHFDRDGFLRCRLLPVVQPGKLTDPPFYYTHQPPGPYIIAGIARRLGAQSVQDLRILPVILTLASAALFYFAMERVFGGAIALCGFFFLSTTTALFYWADALDSYAYDSFLVFAAVACWIMTLTSEGKARRRYAILTWLAAFAEALCSFLYVPFIQLFIWASAFAFRGIARKRRLLVFLAAPALAFLLHFVQNASALGVPDAIEDFRGAFLQRTLEVETSDNYLDLGKYPARLVRRFRHWYVHPAIFLAAWVAAGFALGKVAGEKSRRNFFRMSLVFAASGAVWWIVFAEHTWIHHVTIRQMLPLFALVAGAAFFCCIKLLGSRRFHVALRVLAGILCALALAWQGRRVVSYTRGQMSARDFAGELAPVKAQLPPNAVVVTDHGNHPMIAFLLDRPVLAPAQIERIDALYPDRPLAVLRYDPGKRQAPLAQGSLEEQLLGENSLVFLHGDYLLFTPR